MESSTVIREHCQELIRKKSWVFKWFFELEGAGLAPEELEAASRAYALLAEIVVFQEITDPKVDFATELAKLRLSGQMIPALQTWSVTLREAGPSRKGMNLVLRHFLEWVCATPEACRPMLLEGLPAIAKSMAGMNAEDMSGIISRLGRLGPDGYRAVLGSAACYAGTAADAVIAVCSIGAAAAQLGRESLLERLGSAVSPDDVMSGGDAQRFLPVLARLSDRCFERSPELWSAVLDLVVSIAERGISSAFVTSRDLPDRLAKMDDRTAIAYAGEFRVLAEHVGISATGFGLKRLPELHRTLGSDGAASIVNTAVRIADVCGSTASHWFLAARTGAARKALQEAKQTGLPS